MVKKIFALLVIVSVVVSPNAGLVSVVLADEVAPADASAPAPAVEAPIVTPAAETLPIFLPTPEAVTETPAADQATDASLEDVTETPADVPVPEAPADNGGGHGASLAAVAGSIKVVTPNEYVLWHKGTPMTISWETTSIPTGATGVSLALMNTGTVKAIIASVAPLTTTTYTWDGTTILDGDLAADLAEGLYTIRVCYDGVDTEVCDESDADFGLTATPASSATGEINVTAPNDANANYKTGEGFNITWENVVVPAGATGISIRLMDLAHRSQAYIADLSSTDVTSFAWDGASIMNTEDPATAIPATIADGLYQVEVCYDGPTSTVCDQSADFSLTTDGATPPGSIDTSIVFTNPATNVTWATGTPKTIKWNTGIIPADYRNRSLSLVTPAGAVVAIIADQATAGWAGLSQFTWNVGAMFSGVDNANAVPAGTYKLRLQYDDNFGAAGLPNTVAATSTVTVTISADGTETPDPVAIDSTIVFTNPVTDVAWATGTPQTITWDTEIIPADYRHYTLGLVNADTRVAYAILGDETSASWAGINHFNWLVGTDMTGSYNIAPGQYRLRLEYNDNFGVTNLPNTASAVSDAVITIGDVTPGNPDDNTNPPANTSTGGGTGGGGSSSGGGGCAPGYPCSNVTAFGVGGDTSGAQSLTCDANAAYLTTYIFVGGVNNADEVKKLQLFLLNNQKMDIPVDGVFGSETVAAVKLFQAKYADEILKPWGITVPTGNVFVTTKLKINAILCGNNQPISQAAAAALIEAAQVTNPGVIGAIDNGNGQTLALASSSDSLASSSEIAASTTPGFFTAAVAGVSSFFGLYPWWWWLLVLALVAIISWLLKSSEDEIDPELSSPSSTETAG